MNCNVVPHLAVSGTLAASGGLGCVRSILSQGSSFCLSSGLPPAQDVLVVNCTPEWISSSHVLATCRAALKQQGILGLNVAPCMRAFLERLPLMLQEQYAYEKVRAPQGRGESGGQGGAGVAGSLRKGWPTAALARKVSPGRPSAKEKQPLKLIFLGSSGTPAQHFACCRNNFLRASVQL